MIFIDLNRSIFYTNLYLSNHSLLDIFASLLSDIDLESPLQYYQ